MLVAKFADATRRGLLPKSCHGNEFQTSYVPHCITHSKIFNHGMATPRKIGEKQDSILTFNLFWSFSPDLCNLLGATMSPNFMFHTYFGRFSYLLGVSAVANCIIAITRPRPGTRPWPATWGSAWGSCSSRPCGARPCVGPWRWRTAEFRCSSKFGRFSCQMMSKNDGKTKWWKKTDWWQKNSWVRDSIFSYIFNHVEKIWEAADFCLETARSWGARLGGVRTCPFSRAARLQNERCWKRVWAFHRKRMLWRRANGGKWRKGRKDQDLTKKNDETWGCI